MDTVLTIDQRSGLPDEDVYCVLQLEKSLIAATRSGVYRFDGLQWTSIGPGQAIRWLGRQGDRIWAAGPTGVWVADSRGRGLSTDFKPVAIAGREENPGWETGLVHGDELLLGGARGLSCLKNGSWTSALEGVPVLALEFSPIRGLLIGTAGQGLFVVSAEGDTSRIVSPEPGVTDTLPGNYIHDIAVNPDGPIHLVTSWGGLGSRFIAWRRARDLHVITEEDPFDFRHAARAIWSGQGWSVEYAYQTGYQAGSRTRGRHDWGVVAEGDFDRDGDEEFLVLMPELREYKPSGLVCFDKKTGKQNWYFPAAGWMTEVVAISHGGETWFVVVDGGGDFGDVVGDRDDTHQRLLVLDAQGVEQRRFEPRLGRVQARALAVLQRAGRLTSDPPLAESFFVVADSLFVTGAPQNPADALWRMDPETLDLEPVPLPDVPVWPGGSVIETGHRQLLTSDPRRVPGAGLAPLVRIFDPSDGEVVYEVALDSLYVRKEVEQDFRFARAFTHDADGSWRMQQFSPEGVVEWTAKGLRRIPWTSGIVGAARVYGSLGVFVRRPVPAEQPAEAPLGRPEIFEIYGLDSQRSMDYSDMDFLAAGAGMVHARTTPKPWPAVDEGGGDLRLLHTLQSGMDETTNGSCFEVFTPLGEHSTRAAVVIGLVNRGGVLPVQDQEGRPTGWLDLPATSRNSHNLAWLGGRGPLIDGTRTRLLLDHERFPWKLHALDLDHMEWVRSFEVEAPIFDPGCPELFGLTAICRNGRLVGTDHGLHVWGEGAQSCSGEGHARVRGIDRSDEGTLVWGESGIQLVANRARVLASGVHDLASLGDGYLVVGQGWGRWIDPEGKIRREFQLGRGGRYGELKILYADEQFFVFSSDHGWSHDTETVAIATGRSMSPGDALYHRGSRLRDAKMVRLDDGRLLIAAEYGLVLADADRHVLARELDRDNPVPCQALIRDADHWIVGRRDGAICTVRVDADTLRVVEVDSSRPPERAPLQFLRGKGSRIWVRTSDAVELWQGRAFDTRFDLRAAGELLAMATCPKGGVWLGSESGLWHVDDEGAYPVLKSGIPEGPVRAVFDGREMGADGISPGGPVVLVGDQLVEFPIRNRESSEGGLTLVRDHGDSLDVALGGEAVAPIAGVAMVAADEVRPHWIPGRDLGYAWRVRIPDMPTGRHRLLFYAINAEGQLAALPAIVPRVVRQGGARSGLLSVLIPLLGIGLWAARPRWRFWGLLVALVAIAVVLFGIYQLLLLRIDVSTAALVAVAAALVGVVLHTLLGTTSVDVAAARERLDTLLRAFRHRGSGMNPVDEVLILARNSAVLAEEDPAFETEIASVLKQFLEASDEIATQGPRLAREAGLEQVTTTRFFARLEELRVLSNHLLESSWNLRHWIESEEQRRTWIGAGRTFLQICESLSEILSSYREVRTQPFLEKFVERTARRSDVSLELQVDPVGRLAVPERELSEVLDNLCRNSLRALADAPRARIRISVLRNGDEASMLVEDNGSGVAESLREKIFQSGITIAGGSGFGLTRCRQLVRGWGAEIRMMTSPELGGASVEITGLHLLDATTDCQRGRVQDAANTGQSVRQQQENRPAEG